MTFPFPAKDVIGRVVGLSALLGPSGRFCEESGFGKPPFAKAPLFQLA